MYRKFKRDEFNTQKFIKDINDTMAKLFKENGYWFGKGGISLSPSSRKHTIRTDDFISQSIEPTPSGIDYFLNNSNDDTIINIFRITFDFGDIIMYNVTPHDIEQIMLQYERLKKEVVKDIRTALKQLIRYHYKNYHP